MPKKNAPEVSKKALQKQKQKAIEDKTFGLKNKSKSKKVQQQVESIQKNIMNSGDPKLRKQEEMRKKLKEEQKALRKAAKEEQDALFGAALLAVQKKTNQPSAAKVEAKGRDHNDDNAPKASASRAMKLMYQMDAQEMSEKLKQDNPNYIPTLEDDIEQQRQDKMKQLQGKGTPVTPETFSAWKERKRKQKAELVLKTMEQEYKKKKGGKGLSVLSGRDLYEFKKELFVDRDEDDNNNNNNNHVVEQLAETVNQELFLEEEDDDLDDLEDDD